MESPQMASLHPAVDSALGVAGESADIICRHDVGFMFQQLCIISGQVFQKLRWDFVELYRFSFNTAYELKPRTPVIPRENDGKP